MTRQGPIWNIPKGWGVMGLGDVVEINKESRDPIKEIPNDKFLYVDIESIEGGTGIIKTVKEIVGKKAPSRARRVIHHNDVIMSTVRPYLRAFALVPRKYDNQICSTGFAVLSCKNEILPSYLLHTLFSKMIMDQCNRMVVGGQYPALNQSLVAKLNIPLPPLTEQRKIASILSTVDDAIQKVGEAITKTERLKQGLMQELLTKGIGHERFKDSEVGRIPEEWDVKEIGEISDSHAGGTPHRTNKNYYGGDIPWVKSGEVNQRHIYDTGEKITEEGLKNSSTKKVSKDTVLVAMYGATAGKAGILKIGGTTNQAVLAICPINNNFDYQFMYYLLSSKIHRFVAMTQGTGQPNLSKKIIDNLKIPHPPLPEQREIASILSTVDKKLELERKRKGKLERIKTGLMNDLLTGEKRVKLEVAR